MSVVWRSLCGRTSSMIVKMHCLLRNFSSSPPVRVKLLSPRESHFWYILPNEVNSKALMNQYGELLSSCERDSISSMHTDHLMKSALLAHALVRTTIARYQENPLVTPASIKFKKNVHGKPEVDWQLGGLACPAPLHFNISHTSSLIACGVTIGLPIAIDVEEKNRKIKNSIMSFAKRYFTSYEVECLSAISYLEVQRKEFIKLWILKYVEEKEENIWCISMFLPSTMGYASRSFLVDDKRQNNSLLQCYIEALGFGFSAAPFSTITLRAREWGQITTDSKEYEILIEFIEDSTKLSCNWQLKLLELASSRYAAVCTKKAETVGDYGSCAIELKVWKTIPLVENEFVKGINAAVEL